MTDEMLPVYVCWWWTRASSQQHGFGASAHAIHPTAKSLWGFLLKSVLKPLRIYLPEELKKKFRKFSMESYGYSRGSLSRAAVEAIRSWISTRQIGSVNFWSRGLKGGCFLYGSARLWEKVSELLYRDRIQSAIAMSTVLIKIVPSRSKYNDFRAFSVLDYDVGILSDSRNITSTRYDVVSMSDSGPIMRHGGTPKAGSVAKWSAYRSELPRQTDTEISDLIEKLRS